jgi:enoyl-[acyl-carrier protein] reductase II
MSEECAVHPDFKETFRRAKARDAVATPQFDSRLPVIPVRALKNTGTDEFSKLQLSLLRRLEDNAIDRMDAQYEVERFWMGALRNAAVDGDMKNWSLMAGQSVGLADKILPLQGIFDELVNDAEAEMQRLATHLCEK